MIFFIFAVCDWLPLNYRVHSHSNDQMIKCNLCQGRTSETTEHIFLCPAMREEQNLLRERIDETFRKWSLPYCSLGNPPGYSMKTQWMQILQRKLSAKRKSLTLSGEKMQQLVEDYWAANKNNRHKAIFFLIFISVSAKHSPDIIVIAMVDIAVN